MNITIIGMGHGGCAAAAYYTKQGYNITLLKIGKKMHNENYEFLKKNKIITLTGIEGEGTFNLNDVTNDIAQGISNADIIFIFYVSNFHQLLAEKISPYLKDGQLVYICPGYAGSILFLKEMKKINNNSKVIFVEGETLPFSSRISEPGIVNICSKNYGHPIAALPRSLNSTAIEKLSKLLDKCYERENILEIALHNPNLILHTIGIIMNAGRIEDPDLNFYMYKQGFTPSIWKIVKKLDSEKMDILEKLGLKRRTYFDEFLVRTFGENSINYSAEEGFKIYSKEASELLTNTINNRYLTEDTPIGLGLLHSLGKHLNISTPTCDSLIHLAGSMLDTDYFKEARTIESLGFDNIDDLLNLINS